MPNILSDQHAPVRSPPPCSGSRNATGELRQHEAPI